MSKQIDSYTSSCSWPWTKLKTAFSVIHPSGSTSLSVTNTRRAAQCQLSLSVIWNQSKGQICHQTLLHKRKPSHVCLPCQKTHKWIYPWVMTASSTGIDSGPDDCSVQGWVSSPEGCRYNVILVVGEQLHGPAGRLRAPWSGRRRHETHPSFSFLSKLIFLQIQLVFAMAPGTLTVHLGILDLERFK